MPRNVIYQGDLEELKTNWAGRFIANGECARLPQELTDVGWTGRWLPGPRVVDLSFLLPGTVIANFKFVDGQWKYPNQHGYHAGLFQRYEYGRVMSNGEPASFSMIDQWKGERPKPVGERGLTAYTPERAKQLRKQPCDNAKRVLRGDSPMKSLHRIACLVFCAAPAAQAQVYECPKFYPSQDIVLAEVPYQHQGRGIVSKRVLTNASVMRDDFNKPSGELYGNGEKKVKGGVDIDFPANVTWFVCWYGDGRSIAWWEELKLNQNKVGGCTMQIRDDHRNPKDIKLVCQ